MYAVWRTMRFAPTAAPISENEWLEVGRRLQNAKEGRQTPRLSLLYVLLDYTCDPMVARASLALYTM